MDKYASLTSGEYFHFYRERENISALAGAAWGCDFVAMSEFSHAKLKKEDKDANYLGRCDLYIANNVKEYFVEAKHQWLSLQTRRSWPKAFSDGCLKASKDANSTKGEDEFAVLGITFFGLYMPMSKSENIDQSLNSLEKYFETRPFDAMAWYFPEGERKDQGLKSKNIIPGIAMAVENVSIKPRK